jgi:hypothetical protein
VRLAALGLLTVFIATGPVAADGPTAPAVMAAHLAAAPLPVRDPYDLAVRLRGVPADVARGGLPGAAPAQPNQSDTFWVLDQRSAHTFQVTATLRLITDHAYWYVADDRAERVPQLALEQSASTFEHHTFPTIEHFFGGDPAAFPGDGDPHVLFLLGRVPGVAAYFSGVDTVPPAINPRSNDREMIYVNVDVLTPGQGSFDATMAHEFQHLLHFARCPGQDTWIDEGSSELASRVDGYDGPPPLAFNSRPDVQLTAWSTQPSDQLRHYQAAYLFVRYVAERFGGWETLRQVLQPCLRGEALYSQFLRERGESGSFDDLFADWAVANLVDDATIGDGRYAYAGGSVHVATTATAGPGQPFESTLPQYAADYIELSDGGSAGVFVGDADVSLVGASDATASPVWWSNRGDDVDTRLTRRLDLRGVQHATARFRAWYDVEDQYDYVYLSGSTDGGATWKVLPSRGTTGDAAVGNNYGPGWTGTSGGERGPTWVDEEADLSPLAGNDAEVRFEYVTDQAYNGSGFAMADFAVPELGLFEPGAVDGSWSAEGWLRVDAHVPESWNLRLVQWLPGGVSVDAVAVDSSGRAAFAVDPAASRSVLVVAPTAPRTLERAHYTLLLNPS